MDGRRRGRVRGLSKIEKPRKSGFSVAFFNTAEHLLSKLRDASELDRAPEKCLQIACWASTTEHLPPTEGLDQCRLKRTVRKRLE
jgi:hypothetical protein